MRHIRTSFEASGIYGVLQQDDGTQVAVTLEHAYLQDDGTYAPKLPDGSYTCQRGMWTLDHIPTPFEAFQIMDVPNHTDILLHVGNYNKDSAGCVLLGQSRHGDMIIHSGVTFKTFMDMMAGIDTFQLDVSTNV